jgi:hypothetical protein
MVQAVVGMVTYTSILTFGRFTVQNNFVIGFGKMQLSKLKNINILERKATCRFNQRLQN